MSEELKLCINCKWCLSDGDFLYGKNPEYYCAHPRVTRQTNPVTGRVTAKLCENTRTWNMDGDCGPEARFFEPKESTNIIPESALVETDEAHQFD